MGINKDFIVKNGLRVNGDSLTVDANTGNVSASGTITANNFIGAVSGNADTAAALETARTFTIGNTGRSFDGSENVSWSLGDIGVNDSTLTLSTSGIASGSQTWTSNQGSNATFTVDVPGTNLAEGTRTTTTVPITSSTGSNATLSAATTSLAGVMSSADKSKLDGIETGAQVNVGTNLGSSGTGGTRTITSSTGTNTSITFTASDLDAVPTSRTLTAGDGLSGGGNLGSNLTLSVDGTVVRTSGNQTIGGTKTFSGSIIVDGEARIFDTLRIDGQLTGTNTGMTIPTQGGQSLSIRSDSFSGLDSNVRFRQSGSGSAAARLVVSDGDNADRAIAFRGASGGGHIEASDSLRIRVGPTLGATSEAVRILSSGNVGINTTSPSEKLHVDGNIRVQSGDITLDNNRFFRIRDTANVARGIIHMSTANHVNFGNTQSTARMIIDGTGTGTLLRLNSNNTVSINGNIVGNAVTQSAYDTADSNRVTRVGDFGEGGATNCLQIDDFTQAYSSGVYRGRAIASQMTGAPETANWTSLITIRRGLNNRHFYEWQRASGSSARRWFGYRLGLTGAVEWAEYLHSVNTTEDSNGFIKAASPIVRLFDNKTEEPVKPVDAEFVKVNKGHYELHNVPPLSDKGWQIEVPQDHNGNRLVFVETEYDENTSILTIYTSKREWSSEMGIWVAGERKDIPEDRWVDLRFWESPEEENIEGE